MNIKITETGEVKSLSIIDAKSGVDWTQDLLGNALALRDGQFVYDEIGDVYIADQSTYEWWATYIADTETTEREAQDLADRLGLSVTDVRERIAAYTSGDYDQHRGEARCALEDLAAEMRGQEL